MTAPKPVMTYEQLREHNRQRRTPDAIAHSIGLALMESRQRFGPFRGGPLRDRACRIVDRLLPDIAMPSRDGSKAGVERFERYMDRMLARKRLFRNIYDRLKAKRAAMTLNEHRMGEATPPIRSAEQVSA